MNTKKLYIFYRICRVLPPTRCYRFKAAMLRWCGASVGKNVRICSTATFCGNGDLVIGKDTWIGHGVYISSFSSVTIGESVDIAPQVYIGTGTHEIDPNGQHVAGRGVNLDISIGNGAWLCTNSVILPGVSIGKKSIVAAGAVVIKSCGDKELIAGVPAKCIKKI